jgi:beta-mannosidase
MSRRILDLSTLAWRMGMAPRQAFTTQPTDDRAAVRAWHAARVPGAMRADLIAAGLAPPLDTPEGIVAGEWADAVDWWYEAQLPGDWQGDDLVVLEADGIDDHCAIWLDDRLLATHAGMFARQAVTLSPWVNTSGSHTLAVRIWGAGALPRLPDLPWRRLVRSGLRLTGTNTEYFPDRMATPHAQFSFSWDFAPRIFGTGIWDDIRVVVCRGVYIEDLHAIAEPLNAEDPTPVRWRLRLALRESATRVRAALPAVAEVTVEQDDDFRYVSRVSLNSRSGDAEHPDAAVVELTVETPALRRWWPWDQGEPCLCTVTVRLRDMSGDPLDEISVTTGVRTVRRERLADGSPWRFVVNERPVFLRGANWTPADLLPGTVTPTDYARLVVMAKEAGINFLRVWGGGVRERNAFWQECDRLGIVAWQEFPLACAFLDHYPRTRAYLSALQDEARGIVRSLRNHPSLVAWCGGNEINARRERLPLNTIVNVLVEEEAGRPWIPSSPSDGDVHQWDVWHGYAPWAELQEQDPPFMSEFGMQALPDAATIREMFPSCAPRSLSDDRWTGRKAQAGKLRHYAGPRIDESLDEAIQLTQRAQAAALQAGIEACRIRREGGETDYRPCGGVAVWQLNEPWRAVSWAVVDHAGRPKAAYATLQRSYRPLLIAAQFSRRSYQKGDAFEARVWLVNDLPYAVRRCRAEAWLDDRLAWTAGVDVPALSTQRVGIARVTLAAAPRELVLRLLDGDVVIAENRYDLGLPLPGPRPLTARLIRWLAGLLLRS